MDILKIAAVSVAAMMLALTVGEGHKSFSAAVALSAGVIMSLYFLPYAKNLIDTVIYTAESYNIDTGYIGVLIKVTAVAYICHFASELCRDGGQGAIGAKVEMCGKIIILSYSLPIALALLDTVEMILP